ncbi:hypothetical protein C8J23_13629 [Shewanella chilikensis]|jgi:hypothetical protein|uniref:Uncharacterized protein n=1 Tax=Shewanella chilikensis TaxID=558541 RepID=A0ABX5PJC0_9GAMM|nr:hypothetical protein C8J23_13629 [Shewanella chilikensis]GGZ41612.1 hypothetical protein GCM10007105_30740 [Shewanella chilikensis]GHB20976.1 hypothetical protein GCM10007107_37110 [Shewanella indica]HCD13526.1 hypothetical protein [Shewanella sp.]
MRALRRLTGLDTRRGSQQMALVLCKKHNTAGRLVSHVLRGLESRAGFTDYDRVLCKMHNSVYGLYATPFELTLNIE